MRYKRTKKGIEYVTLKSVKRAALGNAKFKKTYAALRPKYVLIHAIINARVKRGVTQAELARRVGTTQSAIARFEAGRGNPTLDFMHRVSEAVGKDLVVELR